MGITERHTMINQIISYIGCICKAILRGCFHHCLVELHCINHACEQSQTACNGIDRIEYAFFVLLHILIICKRNSLHRSQYAHQRTINTACLAAYQLCNIRILFLRHNAAAGAVSIVNLNKTVFVGVPDNDLL